MILAIDPSLTGTAVVRGDGKDFEVRKFGSTNEGDNVAARIARYDALVDKIVTWLSDRTYYDAIYIEAYSYGSNDARAKFSAEYGGLLRWCLLDLLADGDRFFEVAPMTLKKFVTGVGKGGKENVIAHIVKRYGVMLDGNDEYDAFGLYQLGLVAEGISEPLMQAQREAADKVLGIVTPKPAKKRKAAAVVPELF